MGVQLNYFTPEVLLRAGWKSPVSRRRVLWTILLHLISPFVILAFAIATRSEFFIRIGIVAFVFGFPATYVGMAIWEQISKRNFIKQYRASRADSQQSLLNVLNMEQIRRVSNASNPYGTPISQELSGEWQSPISRKMVAFAICGHVAFFVFFGAFTLSSIFADGDVETIQTDWLAGFWLFGTLLGFPILYFVFIFIERRSKRDWRRLRK